MASLDLQALLSQQAPKLETRKALLVIGLQNDFTTANGKLPVTISDKFWDRLRKFIPAFREFGHVVWVRSESDGSSKESCVIGSSLEVVCNDHSEVESGSPRDSSTSSERPERDDGKEQGGSAPPVEAAKPDEKPADRSPSTSPKRSEYDGKRDRESPVPAKRKRLSLTVEESTPTLNAIGRALTPGSSSSQSSAREPVVDEEFFLSPTSLREACCVRDSHGAKFCTEANDLIDHDLDMKTTTPNYSAFEDGSLLGKLRCKLVSELFICGCPTNSAIYATAMDAARYGFQINLIEDCLTARNEKLNDVAIDRLCDVLEADAMTIEEALDSLRNPSASSENDEDTDESEGEAEHEHVVVSGDKVKGLRGGGVSLEDVDPSVPSALSLDNDLQQLHLSPAATDRSFKNEMECQRYNLDASRPHATQVPTQMPTDNVEKYSQHQQSGPLAHYQEFEQYGNTGNRSAPGLDNASAPIHFANTNTLGETDVQLFLKQARESLQSQTAGSKHPGLNAFAAILHFDQQTVDQYEAMMRQARSSTPQPLFGVDHEAESQGSTISCNLLASDAAESVFDTLKDEVPWQRMYHQTGEVPRLVCCQCTVDDQDASRPVYRHPSDQTLPSGPWSPTVDRIRRAAEEQVGHPLNHALIQLYRNSTDYISEHSDKTLDIVPGTNIVNVSFGAQRTMRLRTKRTQSCDASNPANERTTYRVPMPHNSMIKMTLQTNAQYLHGINADKRPTVELNEAEKAYGGQRISLTFRNIGTFIDADSTRIWGQGATGKVRESAACVVNGDAVESEKLIRAFGAENQATRIVWDEVYGAGSNVLHLKA